MHAQTLLHRTLVFPLGRAGPRPEASRTAHVFRHYSPPYGFMAGFGAAVDDPSRRASALGRPKPARRREAMFNFLNGLRKPPKGAHHQHPHHPTTPPPHHPSTPAPQHPSTPAPQHPSTPAPQHPSTPAPQHPSTPAPHHPTTPPPHHPTTPLGILAVL